MKLIKVDHNEKIVENKHYYGTEYELGGYKVTHYITETPNYTYARVEVEAKDRNSYLPKIYYNDDYFGNAVEWFEIQTTSYGPMKPDEIKKVIAGYQEAIEAVEILTKEFINKTERG